MKVALRAILALVLAVPAGCAGETRPPKAPPGPPAEALTIETPDGWKLSASYAAPKAGKGRKAPAVILVHMLGRTKEDWQPLNGKLADAGYATVAFDLRGHGASRRADGKAETHKDFKNPDWAAAARDLLVVRDWLVKNKSAEVDEKRVAVLGASIGANYALLALADDEQLRGAVLLSPGLSYHEVKIEEAAGKLRKGQLVATFAAKGDKYSAETVERLAKLFPKGEPPTVLVNRIYDGPEHGTLMLGKHAGIEDEILKALGTMTAPSAAAAPKKDPTTEALEKAL